MTQPDLRRVPAAEQRSILGAVSTASVTGFHFGAGVGAGVVIVAGLLGFGLRSPRRSVTARECAGGQLVAAPRDAARRPEESVPEAV
jgi:hypothetical protein